MPVQIAVPELVTNTGEVISCPAPGVTCIVGSNNVGKSQLLRDVVALLEYPLATPVVLSGLTLQRGTVDPEELAAWLELTAVRQPQGPGLPDAFVPIGGGQAVASQTIWQQYVHGGINCLGSARSFFCWFADAVNRVNLASGGIGFPGTGLGPHPLSRLYRDGDLETKLSKLAEGVFGLPLTLDRVNGNVLLRVGTVEGKVPPINRPTLDYSNRVAALPTLESQGDGVKSFVGLALHLTAGHQPLLVVDEPEAFLHPAQSRALGRWLSDETARSARQVILATHDRDIVLGLIDGTAPVTVVRLTREGNESRIRQLHHERLARVWSDPVLRYSNVLQGIFHTSVVVCEGDADCRFYSAVLDALADAGEARLAADEALFVPSGGKERVPSLTAAISALGGRSFAIVDFDVLRDEQQMKRLVTSTGGSWLEIEALYRSTVAPLNENPETLWERVKSQGLSAVPPGQAHAAASEVLRRLAKQRVLIVPVGELEGFNRNIGGKGARWVTAMLEDGGHKKCVSAKELMKAVY